jgi:UDP-3-O-[3-hydroxymyristoyl] glucosamine N-acyltransferase
VPLAPSVDLVPSAGIRYDPRPDAIARGGQTLLADAPDCRAGRTRKDAPRMTNRTTTLGALAELVGGRIIGDPATAIHGAAVLREAQTGEITFVDNAERAKEIAKSRASAVLLPEQVESDFPTAIRVADVHVAFAKIVCQFRPPRVRQAIGVSPHAIVSSTAKLGRNVNVHPGATIGDDCQIGDNATILPGAQILAGCTIEPDACIGPGAILYENTIVGARTQIHGGAVIGAHGFGYSQSNGRHVLAAQLGYVRIGADVEIGAATTIDRGSFGATTIGDGTKIDNLVQIAHNCQIGRHNLICSQVGIAGSTTTGDYVVMGGQAGIRDHVHIGSRAILSAMAGITNNVPDGAVMLGVPATPEREQKLKLAAAAKLPEMRKEFKAMRRAIAALEKALGIATSELRESEKAA